MNKSISKRIRITKNGKLLHRISGQNHFNAKERSTVQQRKKRFIGFSTRVARNIRQYAARSQN